MRENARITLVSFVLIVVAIILILVMSVIIRDVKRDTQETGLPPRVTEFEWRGRKCLLHGRGEIWCEEPATCE